MNTTEQQAILTLCLMAAFADGGRNESERSQLKSLAEKFPEAAVDLAQLCHRVLVEKPKVVEVIQPLTTPELKRLAYEMAVCVCDADDTLNAAEKEFLDHLRDSLGIESVAAGGFEEQANTLAALPLGQETAIASLNDPQVDKMILNYAILTGALELLPESLATMTIVPIQMKMVYRVGKHHGHSLDRHHIKELLGAAGVGLTSQVVEGYARKLLGGLLGKLGAGGTMKRVGDQAASSALSFATTYALGKMAQRYYSGGRTLSALQLSQLFRSLLGEAKTLHHRFAPDILTRARSLNPKDLINLARNP